MIVVALIDGTEIKYDTFDEIIDYDVHSRIIELTCCGEELNLLPDLICYLEYTN